MYESRLSSKIIKILQEKYPKNLIRKRHAGPMRKGQPDITGTIMGQHIEIETKIGDNTPTKIQQKWLRDYHKAGAIVAAVWSINDLELFKVHFDLSHIGGAATVDTPGYHSIDRQALSELIQANYQEMIATKHSYFNWAQRFNAENPELDPVMAPILEKTIIDIIKTIPESLKQRSTKQRTKREGSRNDVRRSKKSGDDQQQVFFEGF